MRDFDLLVFKNRPLCFWWNRTIVDRLEIKLIVQYLQNGLGSNSQVYCSCLVYSYYLLYHFCFLNICFFLQEKLYKNRWVLNLLQMNQCTSQWIFDNTRWLCRHGQKGKFIIRKWWLEKRNRSECSKRRNYSIWSKKNDQWLLRFLQEGNRCGSLVEIKTIK